MKKNEEVWTYVSNRDIKLDFGFGPQPIPNLSGLNRTELRSYLPVHPPACFIS